MKFAGGLKNAAILWALSAGRMLLPKNASAPWNKRRFLVVSTTGIGDTLWGTPAIAALRTTFPDCYIGVLTNRAGMEVLTHNPSIDDLFLFSKGSRGILSFSILIRRLRAEKFDTAIVFHASDRIVLPLCVLAGASNVIGFVNRHKGLDKLLTIPVAPLPGIHAVEARFALMRSLGVQQGDEKLILNLTEEERIAARRKLVSCGIDANAIIIGMHPGAQDVFKRWPLNYFQEVGNALRQHIPCRIIITGGESESSLARSLASKIDDALSFAGQLSLRETAALISKMSLLISNDTGPMHIASAVGTPLVALFCATESTICGPYKTDNALVIQKQKTCSPCVGKKCKMPSCLEQITPKEVIEAAFLQMEHKHAHHNKL
ncbi:MAG TPA: glycosyltransferase family 9 protein [Dissulfurispiraceae bacterium]|nr:glycosyltransferase family 9 protein [Dissulfurispiraceae bacterium]